jgi:nucleoside-diphosphate-sugar epimerase
LARDFGREHGLDVVIARPIGIYGPGDARFLRMFRGIARGRFPMLGDGEAFYHLTYIDDLVEGLRLCGETPGIGGRTYLLAGPRYTTLNQLTVLIARELGVAAPRLRLPVWPFWLAGLACEIVCVPLRLDPPIYRRRVDFFTKSRAFDTTRARTELGFSPKVDLEEGIHRTATWYREQELL